MAWQKIEIETDKKKIATALAPVIISASRSTDIPAFYANWFIERWKRGYIKWKNPFNGVPLYVSFKNARVVVFWSKNPKPMLKHIDFLNEHIKNYYFQFTLNDYDKEGYEGKVALLKNRITTFKDLSQKIGKERVIWRFDPLLLTEDISVGDLLERVENIGDQLKDYTRKLVFSFADISVYKKVENNLKREQIHFIEFAEDSMNEFAAGLQKLNKKWGFKIETCAEDIDLKQYEIKHNKCIDDDLMIELFSNDKPLMDFLGVKTELPSLFDSAPKPVKTKTNKDKGQRTECGCITSKDIGQYNTCPHECFYCYANTSKESAGRNYKEHIEHPYSSSICGL